MKRITDAAKKQPIAPELPTDCPPREFITWQGRRVPLLFQEGKGWRMRSRTAALKVDITLGHMGIALAKRLARERLESLPVKEAVSRTSLEAVAALYLEAPKRCKETVAKGNVSRLRAVVERAWGKTLAQVDIARIPDLWPAYVAARQGSERPDYATRKAANQGINSAMRQAASVFLPALRPYYRRAGVLLPEDAANITWLAESVKRPAVALDDQMRDAWQGLRASDPMLWLVIGLARFAGLRQSEIAACCGGWIVRRGHAAYVEIRDREEQNFWTKRGRSYSALILDPQLAEYLLALDQTAPVVSRSDAARWIQRAPQAWLKPYTGTARAPLHRLRGLYADHVCKITEEAILARQAAELEASRNLGHSTVTTTKEHYLSDPD